jgi:hypothetical protein
MRSEGTVIRLTLIWVIATLVLALTFTVGGFMLARVNADDPGCPTGRALLYAEYGATNVCLEVTAVTP